MGIKSELHYAECSPLGPEDIVYVDSLCLAIDTGSEDSYITKSAALKYNIALDPQETTTLLGFGGAISTSEHSITCVLFNKFCRPGVKLRLSVINQIAGELNAVNLTADDLKLKEEAFSDPLPRAGGPIDILLGQNALTDIVLGSRRHVAGERTIMLWSTIFGWALSGSIEPELLCRAPSPLETKRSVNPPLANISLVSTRKVESTNPSSQQNIEAVEGEFDRRSTSSSTRQGEGKETTVKADLLQLEVTNKQLSRLLQSLFGTASTAVDEENPPLSPSEEEAVRLFHKGLIYKDKRYQVDLPFRPESTKPQNNYRRALGFFKKMERELLRDSTKYELYTNYMKEYINNGHAVEVKTDNPQEDVAYYLPHHGVFKMTHASTKCRVVFNASAPDNYGKTLNDVLLPGPKRQPDLPEVLVRFRAFPHALIGDITKMFLQIKVAPKHRRWLRFLWREPGSNEPVKVYEKVVLPFGLNCSPYLAIEVVLTHVQRFKHQYPLAHDLLSRQLYVDDLISGADGEEQLLAVFNEVAAVMAEGSFEFNKWLSNNKQVMEGIPARNRAKAAPLVFAEKDYQLTPDAIPSTLGLEWQPLRDCFEFGGALELSTPNPKPETMRSLSSRAAKTYDPLGFVLPFLVLAKYLIQECWKQEVKWDDVLPPMIMEPWLQWLNSLPNLSRLSFDRQIWLPGSTDRQLHCFADASERAKCAAVYARSTDSEGRTKVALIYARSKIAPVKVLTIPRLELEAALIGAQSLHKMQRTLGLSTDQVHLWTDSTVVLQWIRKPYSSWKTFVAQRVHKINALYGAEKWRHVPTHENPADIGSRGILAEELVTSEMWFKGPSFLQHSEENWPETFRGDNWLLSEECLEERKIPAPIVLAATINTLLENQKSQFMQRLFRWSNHNKNVRILARVGRFIRNAASKLQLVRLPVIEGEDLMAHEVAWAENIWIRYIQEKHFKHEIRRVTEGSAVRDSKIKNLMPTWDEENKFLVVSGRLRWTDMPEQTKYPIILPADEPLVREFILHRHCTLGHAGPETVHHHLRASFWILKSRRTIKSALRHCRCYRWRARPYKQQFAPLPQFRTEPYQSFVHVGMDYCGPFPIKLHQIIKKQSVEVVKDFSVLVFTCMVSRAVHLEHVASLNVNHFINALKRMIARRGMPTDIYSDNAPTFTCADRQMKELYARIEWPRFLKTLQELPKPVNFHLIPARAPHHGGVWERMVGAIKRALYACTQKGKLEYEEFRTLLCTAEATVNSRPLTRLSDDIDCSLPLTPAHLCIGRALHQIPDHATRDNLTDRSAIKWRARQKQDTIFWRRFQQEYLPAQAVVPKWQQPGNPPKVGEVVLVKVDSAPRNAWPLGTITEVYPGRDCKVRAAQVKIATKPSKSELKTGKSRYYYTRRDIRNLYRLEAEEESEGPLCRPTGTEEDGSQTVQTEVLKLD